MPKTIFPSSSLDTAVHELQHGRLVVIPTETVYGLAANALSPDAVQLIYQVKQRPPTSPLIVHVSSVDMARTLVCEWPHYAELLAQRFWPGPLTLVLPKLPLIPDIVTAGLPTVGLRIPSHPVALEIIRRVGFPLAAPSANLFTRLSPTTAQNVELDLPIVDGGPCHIGIESTVLSLASPDPVLLRPGMISRQQLEDALQSPVADPPEFHGAHPSPGMHLRHYSPKTPVFLVTSENLPPGRGTYLYWQSPPSSGPSIPMPSTPDAYAHYLYDALHHADLAALDWIAVEPPPADPQWQAIHDRLRRAAR